MTKKLTHINEQGDANMVDVGGKPVTERRATAGCYVLAAPATLAAVHENKIAKGDVLATARIAGIQAAKKCADLIPLCHPLMLTHISVDIGIDKDNNRIIIEATCGLSGKTGVEMEALTACSIAALTVYDMCKAIDKAMVISNVRLIAKTGGKSGDWKRDDG